MFHLFNLAIDACHRPHALAHNDKFVRKIALLLKQVERAQKTFDILALVERPDKDEIRTAACRFFANLFLRSLVKRRKNRLHTIVYDIDFVRIDIPSAHDIGL